MSAALSRRRQVVTLYPGDIEQRLSKKLDAAMAAQRDESTRIRRFSEKSQAMQLAAEYDAELAAAEDQAVSVTVWAISRLHWSPLSDSHPPRADDARDAKYGLNMETFPAALLLAALVAPESEGVEGSTCRPTDALESVLAKGEMVLDGLGDLSQLHYQKLTAAAWEVNVSGDDLPKGFSLVSLLRTANEPDSEPQPDSA